MANIFDKTKTEAYVLGIISDSFDEDYASFCHPKAEDDFDYVDKGRNIGLEITTAFRACVYEEMQYELKLKKEKWTSPPKGWSVDDETGQLLMKEVNGIDESVTGRIANALNAKQKKVKKRLVRQQAKSAQLAILLGGVLLRDRDLDSDYLIRLFSKSVFDVVFLITDLFVFIWKRSNDGLLTCRRK